MTSPFLVVRAATNPSASAPRLDTFLELPQTGLVDFWSALSGLTGSGTITAITGTEGTTATAGSGGTLSSTAINGGPGIVMTGAATQRYLTTHTPGSAGTVLCIAKVDSLAYTYTLMGAFGSARWSGALGVNSSGTLFGIQAELAASSGVTSAVTTGTTVVLAMTWSGTTVKFWHDGVLVSTRTIAQAGAGVALGLGYTQGSTQLGAAATIGGWAAYSVALSDDDCVTAQRALAGKWGITLD